MNSDRSVQYGAHNLRGLELTWGWTSLRPPPLIQSAVCYLFVVYGSVIQLRRFRFLTLRSRAARKRDTDAARLFARSLSSNYNANEMLFMWPPAGRLIAPRHLLYSFHPAIIRIIRLAGTAAHHTRHPAARFPQSRKWPSSALGGFIKPGTLSTRNIWL